MLIKQKSQSLPKNWVPGIFGELANSAINKDRSAVFPLFNKPDVLSSASDKAKLFGKNFSKNYNFDNLGTALPIFRTNLKMHISLTSKMVKNIIKNI